ncbi:MAG: M23 family metallopeptidase [Acidobacteriia bacterium]|jgi:murein DD-endopeptidase MepM/ murein hydrolase activator NlpD|nr:M23 family metallopeptidase [Terriglobia bacterium]
MWTVRTSRLWWLPVVLLACPPNSPTAREADWQSCAEGIAYRLSDATPQQGAVVLLELRGAATYSRAEGRWGEQPLHFWPAGEALHQALVGVDLARRPGKSPLVLTATRDDGTSQTCTVPLQVRSGDFPIERLRVAPRFVNPPPEVLPRIAEETERLRALFAAVTPQRLWHGRFLPPIEGLPPAGNFGRRRVLNEQPRAPHTGEDFPAPTGTPVRAAQRGRVVLAEELYFAGKTVLLDHGLGLYTMYAHLHSITTQQGAVVEAGAVIGTVGATGRVTGPHLHWAARLNDARVNPQDLLALPVPAD